MVYGLWSSYHHPYGGGSTVPPPCHKFQGQIRHSSDVGDVPLKIPELREIPKRKPKKKNKAAPLTASTEAKQFNLKVSRDHPDHP